MTTKKITIPDGLKIFIGGDPKRLKALEVLSAAVSLTDELAVKLLVEILKYDEEEAKRFIEALHGCDFIIERN
jgi:hypothetical protein